MISPFPLADHLIRYHVISVLIRVILVDMRRVEMLIEALRGDFRDIVYVRREDCLFNTAKYCSIVKATLDIGEISYSGENSQFLNENKCYRTIDAIGEHEFLFGVYSSSSISPETSETKRTAQTIMIPDIYDVNFSLQRLCPNWCHYYTRTGLLCLGVDFPKEHFNHMRYPDTTSPITIIRDYIHQYLFSYIYNYELFRLTGNLVEDEYEGHRLYDFTLYRNYIGRHNAY